MAAAPTQPTYSFDVPVKTASTSNLREHPMARYRRTDAQKRATRRRCPEWTAGPLVVVRLTRVSPRQLDDDNVRGALKSVRDAVATWLRVDDASPLVRWEYLQAKGATPLVRVQVMLVSPVGTGAAPTASILPEILESGPGAHPLVEVEADAGGLRVVREPGSGRVRAPRSLAALATPATYRPGSPR
ncbi:hypothetical protein JQX13_38825 [Archangium violaceum]|uniref:hypothetical protein n=1 Tax=Archangium violaceum TaxID=83451 RepID=UPI00193C0566|nr:hypothetical protein [Archangium violaceum]QRK06038.1 hypothetical protein JQX13_38825 [Archangium violaceum]